MSENSFNSRPKWLFYTYLAILVWAPLPLASNRDWLWSLLNLSVFLLAAFTLLIGMLRPISNSAVLIRSWPMILLWSAWLCLLLLQAFAILPGIQTVDLDASRDFLLRSLALFVFFLLTLVLVDSRRRLVQLAWVMVLAGAFQAFYGSVMTLSGIEYGFLTEKEHYRGVATGTFVNRNHLAGFLEMTLAVGIGLLLAGLNENVINGFKNHLRNTVQWFLSKKIILRVLLAVMVVGLVLTHSRMGNSAFFISLSIAGLIWLVLEKKKPKRGVVFLLATLFIIDIVIVGTWFGIEKVADRLENTSALTESRDEVNRDSLVYLEDYFWFGSGAGTFRSVFPAYRQADIPVFWDHAHNDIIQFAVETGVIGLGLLMNILLFSVLKALQQMRSAERSIMRGMAFATLMGVTSLIIHSAVDFNLQIPANSLYFVVLLALPWVALKRNIR